MIRSEAGKHSIRALLLPLFLFGAGGCASPAPFLSGSADILVSSFRDGPPARVTGGFGEDSCFACHFGEPQNDAAGSIALSGFPERYTPGEVYELELIIARPDMAAAGFQLAIRHAEDMSQAGWLQVPEQEQSRVGMLSERDVQFAHQLIDGAELEESHTNRWRLLWTAPDSAGQVVVHVSAVAADGDDSQTGDHVYTFETSAQPQGAVSRR